MKRNLITLVGAVAIIGGVVYFNTTFNKRMDPKQADAAEEQHSAAAEETAAVEADPAQPAATQKDSDAYRVKFQTSKGDFVVEVNPQLSPLGAAQFKQIIEEGVYDNAKFFRVVPGFVVQWGIPADPKVAATWQNKNIKDEPVKASNVRGTITYAKSSAPNSRSNQVFINLADNSQLDGMGFAPFGKVVEGMDVVQNLNGQYADAPTGRQGEIAAKGNAFLDEKFPGLDYIEKARVIEDKNEG